MAIKMPTARVGVPQGSRVVFHIIGSPKVASGFGPPFELWVPPGTMDLQYAKRINRYITRGAWVEEHWGEQLDIISASGSTGMWLDPDCGLVATKRKNTPAYKNYENFLSLYKNNAAVYNTKGKIIETGRIVISYQYNQWEGYFENFTVKETDQYPFRFELSWTFKVQYTLFGM